MATRVPALIQLSDPRVAAQLVVIVDVLTVNIEKDPPWAMMFADDLCAMTREEVEEDLEH